MVIQTHLNAGRRWYFSTWVIALLADAGASESKNKEAVREGGESDRLKLD